MSEYAGSGRGENAWNAGNPWNRDCFTKSTKKNGESNQTNSCKNAENRFKTAHKEMQASVQKHLKQEYESSSDEEELQPEPILKSVLKDYSELNNSQAGLEKINQFLENSFQSGAGTCLICLATVKRIDPIWNCLECYGFFHLICIQKWSRDSIFQQKQSQNDLPEFKKTDKINWPCPKCRHEYDQSNIPEKYYCFCGAVQDPTYQPFLVPHSCGERCNKLLKPECGHSCLLLCHPGPCPPCPKTVHVPCHCKKEGPKVQRCGNKFWSCSAKCGKPLLCKKHFCEDKCHPGECSPCSKVSIQECNCGLQKRRQPCRSPEWQCEKVCGKPFSCGFHSCSLVCHSGRCGECPRSLRRTCPCGKTEHQLPCTEEISTCNETCGKILDCGVHYCPQKCHRDKCGMCLEIVTKVCRCGQHRKELPCEKEFLCGSKCKRLRNCSRHPCSRKCCDSNCPPCEKQCSRTLSCGNHKCPSVCHKGQCYPCPEVVQIKCRCGKTVISVPCGREKRTKPPRCSNICLIPPNCHHASREPHRCHYGECPPCEQICGKERKNCKHRCSAPCHSSVWRKINENPCPSDPWEAAQVQIKRCNLPCPDCEVPVPVTCLGGHETVDRPCFKAVPAPCNRPCGRLLKCGNHKCEKQCHRVLTAGDAVHEGENCSECDAECVKERPEGCKHKCPNPCHPGDCPPCKMYLKMKCHCSIVILHITCGSITAANEETKESLLSCGNSCPKTYSCGHGCQSNCHSGECPQPEMCRKKVKLSCKCGKVKKTVACDLMRKEKLTLLECVETCQAKAQGKGSEEKSDAKEAGKTEGKIRLNAEDRQTNGWLHSNVVKCFALKYWYLFASALIAVVAAAIFYSTQ